MFERIAPNGLTRATRAGWRVVALPALAAIGAVVVALAWIDPSVLCVAAGARARRCCSLLRRYPGERMLLALLARAGAAADHGRGRGVRPAPDACSAVAPRGGLLLACSLAVRPPPASAARGGLRPAPRGAALRA